MSLLSVESIHVRRGRTEVIHGVSFEVHEGEVVTLLGSNGAGKSTILRTISGLHRPDSGFVVFAGEQISGRPPRDIVRAGIAHVPEGRQIFPGLTVRENLEMGAYARGRASAADIAWVVERFPVLERVLTARAGTLSGGQQQMLAIGRGLISRPKLLLLDEPSLGLAPLIVRSIAQLIRDLREQGVPVLLVEQNAGLALETADRAYVIGEGRVVAAGQAEELRSDSRVKEAYLGV